MLTLRNGTLTIREGRLTLHDGLVIDAGATLHNDAEVYTHTTISYGEIAGNGTLWAWWVTSEFIGGIIGTSQTVVYYGDRPVDSKWIQVMSGSIIVTPPTNRWSFTD